MIISSKNKMKKIKRSADISVIIPVYNCEKYLDECLQALIKQQFAGVVEISIFNDCSTDDSLSICMKWKSKFLEKGFLWVLSSNDTGQNIGPGHSRNKAVEQSCGDYLCIHDSDDISDSNRLEKQFQASKQYPDALIGCKFRRIPEGSTQRYTDWYNSLTPEKLELQQYREVTLVQPTWFLARNIFKKIGGYAIAGDEEFKEEDKNANRFGLCEDLKFFYKYLDLTENDYNDGKIKRRLHMVPDTFVTYRFVNGSMSSQTPRRVLLRLRVRAFERRVLAKWPSFTIWGAGRDGKDFFNTLLPENREKVLEFCDIDQKKIKNGYHNPKVKRTLKVRHFSEAKPPLVICVALGRMEAELRANIATLGLKEGVDYYHFT